MEEIKVNMENLTDEERKQFLALIEKSNETKIKMWKPEMNEAYYSIDMKGGITHLRCEKDPFDKDVTSIGNYFRIRKEAEFMVERLKVLQELKELANGYKFEYMKNNYFISYSYNDKKIRINYYNEVRRNDIYFATKEDAEKAIKEIGEDRLKKYYFCV